MSDVSEVMRPGNARVLRPLADGHLRNLIEPKGIDVVYIGFIEKVPVAKRVKEIEILDQHFSSSF